MRNRAFLFSAILIALCLTAAFAADVSGKWKGSMEGPMGTMELTFDLKVDGEKLSGTVTNPMGEEKIQEGTIKGDDISFVVLAGGGDFRISYKGKVAGDEMKLTMSFGDMGGMELTAKRVK
jgi:hypothetical protein